MILGVDLLQVPRPDLDLGLGLGSRVVRGRVQDLGISPPPCNNAVSDMDPQAEALNPVLGKDDCLQVVNIHSSP